MTPESDLQTISGLKDREAGSTVINSAHVWNQILHLHPEITNVVFGYYYLSTKRKERTRKYSVGDLLDSNYLENGRTPPPEIPIAGSGKLMCAISAIVGTDGDRRKNTEADFPAASSSGKRLENPLSFVNLDFTCEPTGENIKTATVILAQKADSFFVFNSGRSLQATIDKLVTLDELPSIWGGLIGKFSELSSSEFVREKGARLSDSLIKNSGSRIGLTLGTVVQFRETFREVREKFETYEDFSKLTFLDWAHSFHSLTNLLRFRSGLSAGAGYIRISGKRELPPPALVAGMEQGSLKTIELDPAYFSLQPQLL